MRVYYDYTDCNTARYSGSYVDFVFHRTAAYIFHGTYGSCHASGYRDTQNGAGVSRLLKHNEIKHFVNRNAKGSSIRVTLMVVLACLVIGVMTSASGTIVLLSSLLLEICKDTGMDSKRLFKPTADLCNWASVQTFPIGTSIAYFMWFNSYLEAAGTELRYGLFDFTFIKFPMWLVLVAYYLFMSHGQKLKDETVAKVTEDNKPKRYTP